MSDVTVIVTTLDGRQGFLDRLVASIAEQTYPANLVINKGEPALGPARNRNAALAQATTEFVAFVDDDDELLPDHIRLCREFMDATQADVVYPWFEVVGGPDPLGWFGRPFDPVAIRSANYIPVTVLARTDAVRAVGGFADMPNAERPFEDWYLWLRMLDNDARFSHLPMRTWRWYRDHPGSVASTAA